MTVNQSNERLLAHRDAQIEKLFEICLYSEQVRTRLSTEMRSYAGRLEQLTNSVFNSDLQAQLRSHSSIYVQEQFKHLFEAIKNISADYKREDHIKKRMD